MSNLFTEVSVEQQEIVAGGRNQRRYRPQLPSLAFGYSNVTATSVGLSVNNKQPIQTLAGGIAYTNIG
jgi:hypothetical protein